MFKLSKLIAYTSKQIETEYFQYIFFIPIFISIGILIYFNLNFEPNIYNVFLIFLLTFFSVFIDFPKTRKYFIFKVLKYAILFTVLGFLVITIKANVLNTFLLNKTVNDKIINGRVIRIEQKIKYNKLILDNIKILNIGRYSVLNKIKKLQINFDTKYKLPEIGKNIIITADLKPFLYPITSKSFNFRRYYYFNEISGSGFLKSNWEYNYFQNENNIFSKIIFAIYKFRQKINEKISSIVKSNNKDIIMSIMTGKKYYENDLTTQYKVAGVSHILSISGLHFGIIMGFVFFIIRYFLLFFPYIRNKYDIKKITAILTFFIGIVYLITSGGRIPTIRAFIMFSFMMLAILADKNPVSIRIVVLSMLIILLLYPESLITAGFQLSFAATITILKFFENKDLWMVNLNNHNGFYKYLFKFLNFINGIILSSVAVSVFTIPIIIYHFNTINLYGFLGNLLVMPIFSFFIMPTVLLTFVFIPFNFVNFFLLALDFEINIINKLTLLISKLPFTNIIFYGFSTISFVLIYFGILVRLIFKTNLKNIGYIFIFTGIFYNFFSKVPDIIVNRFGNIFAVKNNNQINILNLSNYKIKDYEINEYKKIFKLNNVVNTIQKNWMINKTKIAFVNTEKDIDTVCKRNDIIFLTKPKYQMNFNCNEEIFDNIFFLTTKGSEFYINNNVYKLDPVIDVKNKRIWE